MSKDRSKLTDVNGSAIDAVNTLVKTENKAPGKSLKEKSEAITSLEEKADNASKSNSSSMEKATTSENTTESMMTTQTETYTAAGAVGGGKAAQAQVIKTSSRDTVVKSSEVRNVQSQNQRRYEKQKAKISQ